MMQCSIWKTWILIYKEICTTHHTLVDFFLVLESVWIVRGCSIAESIFFLEKAFTVWTLKVDTDITITALSQCCGFVEVLKFGDMLFYEIVKWVDGWGTCLCCQHYDIRIIDITLMYCEKWPSFTVLSFQKNIYTERVNFVHD